MKLEKLNKKQIALANDKMNLILGGRPSYGDTRFAYCNATPYGEPSSDRITETYVSDGAGGGFWSETGRSIYMDPPSNT